MLPQTICVLDIETSETNFKDPASSKVAIVGVKVYKLSEDAYAPKEFKCFLADQMSELGVFLRAFPGIIIGHNIFEFDFRVLRAHIFLEGIIEKTADTLYFLHGKNDYVITGLGLDNLCLINFGEGKTIEGKKVSEMWRQGKHEEVILYNENDCDLTQRLWWELVSARKIYTECWEGDLDGLIEVTKADLRKLTCEKPVFTSADWEKKMAASGRLMKTYYRKREKFDNDYHPGFEFQEEVAHYMFYCAQCDKTMLFEAKIVRGFAEDEKAICPECQKVLGEVRCDVGMPLLLGTVEGNHGIGMSQGMVPTVFEEVIRKRIEDTRLQWEEVADTLPIDDRCSICNKPPHPTYELYDNPVDGTPICIECITACRWLLSVK